MNFTAREIAPVYSNFCGMHTHNGRGRFLLHVSVLIVSIVMLALAPDGYATTFTVTGPDDPVPNGCLPGDCSLREAIAAANGNANADVIEVPAGNYALTRGKLTITGGVQIHGTGAATVEGDGTFPVFDIVGTVSVTLSHLTIRGHGRDAIYSDKRADTILEFISIPDVDSTVWVTDPTGGTGSVDIRTSEIHAHVFCRGGAACRVSDSAILALTVGFDSSSQIDLEIVRSSIDGESNNNGTLVVTNGKVTISTTTIRNTYGLEFRDGTPSSVLLDHLAYTGNTGPVIVTVPTSVSVDDSTFSGNIAGSSSLLAGAIYASGGSDWDISNSTFAGNIGKAAVGGAVLVTQAAHMAIRNSTFSGNSFSAIAAGHGARGAAIGYEADPSGTSLLLQQVTIVPPTIAPAGILGTAIGGIGGESGLALTVLNSIVRGTCSLDANAMDINLGNIESPGDTCDLDHANNQVNISSGTLALGALGDHGGATQTYQPGTLSPAIDNAAPAFCLATDQRGYQRPFGGGCDVGAVEVDAEDRVFANGFQ
jgi:CSLREA domain-containing protein